MQPYVQCSNRDYFCAVSGNVAVFVHAGAVEEDLQKCYVFVKIFLPQILIHYTFNYHLLCTRTKTVNANTLNWANFNLNRRHKDTLFKRYFL